MVALISATEIDRQILLITSEVINILIGIKTQFYSVENEILCYGDKASFVDVSPSNGRLSAYRMTYVFFLFRFDSKESGQTLDTL